MGYTQGPWIYDPNKYAIISTKEYLVDPEPEEDEEGIPQTVISTYGVMGGNDCDADIKLICAAPIMVEFLQKLLHKYDASTGGVLSSLSNEEVLEMKNIVNQIY